MADLCVTKFDENTQFYENEERTHTHINNEHLLYITGTLCCILGHRFRQE